MIARKREAMERTDGVTTTENKVWYLRKNRLFARSGDDVVADAAGIFTVTLEPARKAIFEQGDTERVVFLIKRGTVRIARITEDGKEIAIAVLGAGDLFGEETLFGSGPRRTIATCLEETLLCRARADDLIALMADDASLSLSVASVLHDRLDDASDAIEDLAYARVPDRLMNLFRRLAVDHGRDVPEGRMIDVRLTHFDLATLIGSTRETVSLELSHLIDDGRVLLSERRFVLPQSELSS